MVESGVASGASTPGQIVKVRVHRPRPADGVCHVTMYVRHPQGVRVIGTRGVVFGDAVRAAFRMWREQ